MLQDLAKDLAPHGVYLPALVLQDRAADLLIPPPQEATVDPPVLRNLKVDLPTPSDLDVGLPRPWSQDPTVDLPSLYSG